MRIVTLGEHLRTSGEFSPASKLSLADVPLDVERTTTAAPRRDAEGARPVVGEVPEPDMRHTSSQYNG